MLILLKALKLIDKGLSSKTVSKLTESQIDTLYSRMISEQTMVSKNKDNLSQEYSRILNNLYISTLLIQQNKNYAKNPFQFLFIYIWDTEHPSKH